MERSILPAMWQVPQVFRQRIGNKAGRQRAMLADDHLLLILHRPPQPDEREREGRFFWRQPDGNWSSSDHGAGANSLGKLLDEYTGLVDAMDQMEEAATSVPEYFMVINSLSPVLRAARHLHLALDDGRKLVPGDRDLLNFRDRAYEIERSAELLFNDTKNSLDFLDARRAEQQSATSHRMERAAHRLNLLAAFFLPVATIASILDVDPDTALRSIQRPWTLVAIIGVGLIAGLLLTSLVGGSRPIAPTPAAKPKPPSTPAKRR